MAGVQAEKHSRSPRICVVGACNVDLIAYVPRLPKLGETLKGHSFQQGTSILLSFSYTERIGVDGN